MSRSAGSAWVKSSSNLIEDEDPHLVVRALTHEQLVQGFGCAEEDRPISVGRLGHTQLAQRAAEGREAIPARPRHRPAQVITLRGEHLLDGGDQAGLGEGRFTAPARARHEHQDRFISGGCQTRNRVADQRLSSAVESACHVRVAGQARVRIGAQLADVVPEVLGDVDDVATGDVALDGDVADTSA